MATWPQLLEAAARIGLSEDAFWDMLPRELHRRLRMHAEAERAEDEAAWQRTLLLTNHIRGALGAEPLTLDDLRAEEENLPTADDWAAAIADLDKRRSQAA